MRLSVDRLCSCPTIVLQLTLPHKVVFVSAVILAMAFFVDGDIVRPNYDIKKAGDNLRDTYWPRVSFWTKYVASIVPRA